MKTVWNGVTKYFIRLSWARILLSNTESERVFAVIEVTLRSIRTLHNWLYMCTICCRNCKPVAKLTYFYRCSFSCSLCHSFLAVPHLCVCNYSWCIALPVPYLNVLSSWNGALQLKQICKYPDHERTGVHHIAFRWVKHFGVAQTEFFGRGGGGFGGGCKGDVGDAGRF